MSEPTETYGDLLRMMRTLRGFGSREMAKKLNMDEGNYSRLENGFLTPPSTKEKVDKQLKPLEITKWQSQMFYDRAILYNSECDIVSLAPWIGYKRFMKLWKMFGWHYIGKL